MIESAVIYGNEGELLKAFSSHPYGKLEIGEFVKIEDSILARVERANYDQGIYCDSENDIKNIVYRCFSSEKKELTDFEKKWLYNYTYYLRPLAKINFETGPAIQTPVLELPNVGSSVSKVETDEAEQIVNFTNYDGVKIGTLIGNKNVTVKLDLTKLFEKRTMVFAQSGHGKTNFIKLLIYHLTNDEKYQNYGKLVFDLNGEYAINGTNTYGFCSLKKGRFLEHLSIYSDREEVKKSPNFRGEVKLDVIEDIYFDELIAYLPGATEVMTSFLLYLRDDPVLGKNFLKNVNTYINEPHRLHADFASFFGDPQNKDASARKTIAAINKRIKFLTNQSIHEDKSTFLKEIKERLQAGETVIIDLSTKDNLDSMLVSSIICRHIFENNKTNYSDISKQIPVLIFFEEAQNILSEDFVKDNSSIFVRVAKEGRKYKIGLVAITQRPSAIAEEIRSQSDNFFCFHLSNSHDIDTLIKSNIAYEGLIQNFIQNTHTPGYMYMLSSGQPFVIPTAVTYFEDFVAPLIYPEDRLTRHKNLPFISD